MHGIDVSVEDVKLARVALSRLGLVGKGVERDRRPTQAELDVIMGFYASNPLQLIPMARIVRFAVATAMRQEEICMVQWSDLDIKRRLLTVRDRKDPRRKDGNHQKVPMLNLTGFDAGVVLGILSGLAVGALNSLFVVGFKIPSFLVTLGTMQLIR